MGKLAEIKTKATTVSVTDFIDKLTDETKRKDSKQLLSMMEKAMKVKPKIWGNSIVGFGDIRIKSPGSGREVDWFIIGFAPRKTNLSIYLSGQIKLHAEALKQLGKHKTGVGCLYINKLADIDIKVLESMIKLAAKNKSYF